ncbi:MAG: hypothetical protein KA342_01255 [Aminivibrio sp.]|nr:hypothetical protein [Aminivibrio sp.]
MKIEPVRGGGILPPLPAEDGGTDREEALKKVEKARREVEKERLDIMDRHHETVKKSAETYDKLVKKKLLEEEIEKRRLLQREYLGERAEDAELRRKRGAQKAD